MTSDPSDRRTRRRPLLIAFGGGAASAAGLGVAARAGLLGGADGTGRKQVLELSAGTMGVDRLEVRLDDGRLVADGQRRWHTDRLATSTHSMVGFTWRRGEPEPEISISSREMGAWQPWQTIPHLHDSPDRESKELTDVVGTDVAWIGRANGIRVQVDGHLPEGLTMVLLYPNPLPDDRRDHDLRTPSSARRIDLARARTSDSVPMPELLHRDDWGADERLRDGSPDYDDTIQQVHVHHTANSNAYKRHDVPRLIRGMYAYHTQSLGWSDIGYNFLVDRFGRTWVGRAGGPARPVRGAHTLGFNATSTGVSVIGNFDEVVPGPQILAAIAHLAAWKLDKYARDARGFADVLSEGSDNYRAGAVVHLPVIDGHRDTNDTACPGQHLYDALPSIRRRTQRRIDYFHRPPAGITQPFTAAGSTVVGDELRIEAGAWTPPDATPSYTWRRDGEVIPDATAARYLLSTADLGSVITAEVDIAPKGYRPASQALAFPGPVKARTQLAVRAIGRRSRLVVFVDATAPGLAAPPTGEVTISTTNRSDTVALTAGSARIAFHGLAAGTYQVTVDYPGADGAAAASATATADVNARH